MRHVSLKFYNAGRIYLNRFKFEFDMKIIHIASDLSPASGGMGSAVTPLLNILAEFPDTKVELHTLRKPVGLSEKVISYEHPANMFLPWHPSPEMYRALLQSVHDCDILHHNLLWLAPNCYPDFIRKRLRRPIKLVWSPHGTLSRQALAISRWKKKLLWHWQRPSVMNAELLHATSAKEYEEIRAFGLKQPVAVLPHGIDDCRPKTVAPHRPTIVFLGRLHPIKGLELLLMAWARLQLSFPEWSLEIIGEGDPAYVSALHGLVKKQKIKRVSFPGTITGPAKFEILAKSAFLVLPSFSENFGMVVSEALMCGIPVIASQNTPWSILEQKQCGFWIENTLESWINALRHLMLLPEATRQKLGENGRNLILKNYSWERMGERIRQSYAWLLEPDRQQQPSWIWN